MKKYLFTITLLIFMSGALTACSGGDYVPSGGQHQSGGGHSH